MPPPSHILAFAAVVAALVAVPGPSVLFTISRALTVGRRAALFSVTGSVLGVCVQVVAVAFGAGPLVERSAAAFSVLKWAAGAYLAWLGVEALRHRRELASALAERGGPVRPGRAVRDGLVVGATNPKTIVFFMAVLPEFAVRAPGYLPVPEQMLILGAVFPVVALVLDSAWAAAAGAARDWLVRSPRRLAVVGGTGGLVMIGLGVGIAATGHRD